MLPLLHSVHKHQRQPPQVRPPTHPSIHPSAAGRLPQLLSLTPTRTRTLTLTLTPTLTPTRTRTPTLAPPQVLVSLSGADVLRGHPLSPTPFVIPQSHAVPSLVCEVWG